MPNPTARDVHVNKPLTNISIAYLQNAQHFVATRVFPNIPVAQQSDVYYTYDRGDFNRDEAKKRAPGTESAGNGYDIDNSPNYFAHVYGFHKDIADQVRANADSVLNPDREATEFVTHKALIKREKVWTTNYFSGSVWTNDYDGVASSPGANQTIQWSDTTNGDPIGDIRAAKTTVLQSTGFMPNTLVVGQEVMDALVDHPDIVDRVKYSGGVGNNNPAMVNEQTIAQLMGLDRVMVMRAIENTADDGQTNSHSFIGGKKALLCYSAPSPGIMTPSAGYTFSWTGYTGAGPEGNRIKRFRMESLESDRIEIAFAFDSKLVSADLGFFWDAIVV